MQNSETTVTSEIKEPYTMRDGMVCVCSTCFPGSKIIELFPDLAGRTISHGMCLAHANAILKAAGLKPLTK